MAALHFRKQLSIQGLLSEARRSFAVLPDPIEDGLPLVDHRMSGLALFGLKYPSRLQFDKDRQSGTRRANLKTL